MSKARAFEMGDRVKLVSYTELLSRHSGVQLGELGTVRGGPDIDGDYHVAWADGTTYANPEQLEPEHAQALPAPIGVYQLGELFLAFTELGPNARALLLELAARLVKGKAHGDFENAAARDWHQEALEEDLDGIVYRALGAMQRAGRL